MIQDRKKIIENHNKMIQDRKKKYNKIVQDRKKKYNKIIQDRKKNIKNIYTQEYYSKFLNKKSPIKKSPIKKSYPIKKKEAKKRVYERYNMKPHDKLRKHIPFLPSIEELKSRYNQDAKNHKKKVVKRKKNLLIKIGSKHERRYNRI